ncbi:HNH endonuclease [Leptolyngbya iicbica]|uniref:HNH endonuclease n=2 Tax=Cyanophyceae TaxID=3028117 RepID=A0A4V2E2S9_9CYAN|nr:HNH endonuclease [Leptolyngbya sp. LK]RZM79616.1 HNH endonuclease [Leptolyngbya sp. LK]
MPAITQEMIRASYDIAKQIYDGAISHKDGLDELVDHYGMNRNSAGDYVHNYKCMLEARRFPRTSNAYGTEYYLQKIHEDGGRTCLLNALSALRQHIDYYEDIGNTTLHKQREICARFTKIAAVDIQEIFPSEVTEEDESLLEGKTRKVSVNVYERNPIARQQCVDHYGCKCVICDFDFEETYGDIGKSFIHVHHLVEISSISNEYSIDAINDLRPVCPNCHAMLHKKKPAYTISEVKQYLTTRPT